MTFCICIIYISKKLYAKCQKAKLKVSREINVLNAIIINPGPVYDCLVKRAEIGTILQRPGKLIIRKVAFYDYLGSKSVLMDGYNFHNDTIKNIKGYFTNYTISSTIFQLKFSRTTLKVH